MNSFPLSYLFSYDQYFTELNSFGKASMIVDKESYDVIFDTIGKSSFSSCKPLLAMGGRYLLTVGGLRHFVYSAWSKRFGDKKLIVGMSVKKHDALKYMAALCEAGDFKPIIDRRYSLAQLPEAHRYIETGHKRGNVVILVEHP